MNLLILDYGMGNLHTVWRKLNRLGVKAVVSSDPADMLAADKLILPGVGHFKMAMQQLEQLNLLEPLHEAVLVKQKPILGICLGMQLMAKSSEEGNVAGLGWMDAHIVRFKVTNTLKYKVPHMGWNQIIHNGQSALMKGIPNLAEFYFVHSYHAVVEQPGLILNETEYSYKFCSAFEKGNIFGVQYHPEKSHGVGELLLKNFVEL